MEEVFTGQLLIINILFLVLGFFVHAYLTKVNAVAAKKQGKVILADASKEADVVRREAKVQAKDAVLRAREKAERESSTQRKSILDLEKRVMDREKNLTLKLEMLSNKELKLVERLTELNDRETALKEQQIELEKLIEKENKNIETAAQLSKEKARKTLLDRMEEEVRAESSGLIRHIQKETQATAERRAREIISTAIQRYAAEQVCDITTSIVSLESDDIKGRIIGREGRNIKSFEAETGVNVLIDETPEVVVLSSFDPIRREVARLALDRLIEDGRIHPVRIEETVAQVRKELNESIRQAGENALYGLGITGVAPEVIEKLGALKFRTSYKQNVLDHSIETAHLMAMMAGELGLDPKIAKRIGIFHDLGKAIDHEAEGGHDELGAKLLRRYGEDPAVYKAVGSHHADPEESMYSVLCCAADAITAARPGARSETTDLYLQRLEKIENIALEQEGVQSCYAVQAGREVRVMVEHEKVNDQGARLIARTIANRIAEEAKVPGVVRVTVIRETRCVEYAR